MAARDTRLTSDSSCIPQRATAMRPVHDVDHRMKHGGASHARLDRKAGPI
jgi:hypothetical protein